MLKIIALIIILTCPSALFARELNYVGNGRYYCSGDDCGEYNARQQREDARERREIAQERREIERDIRSEEQEYRELSDGEY